MLPSKLVSDELTLSQVSDLLNVSPSFVIKLLENGIIPYRLTGTHYRIPAQDALAYREKNLANRHKALDELAALDQELGL